MGGPLLDDLFLVATICAGAYGFLSVYAEWDRRRFLRATIGRRLEESLSVWSQQQPADGKADRNPNQDQPDYVAYRVEATVL